MSGVTASTDFIKQTRESGVVTLWCVFFISDNIWGEMKPA